MTVIVRDEHGVIHVLCKGKLERDEHAVNHVLCKCKRKREKHEVIHVLCKGKLGRDDHDDLMHFAFRKGNKRGTVFRVNDNDSDG